MIYLLYENFDFNNDFIKDLKNEFLKAKKINVFCHKNDKQNIINLLHINKLNNKLIKVYFHDLKLEYKKIYINISDEEKEIIESVDKFNYPQYIASVSASHKNLLINAGAGTGKTTTIVETVLNLLLDYDAKLEDILLTTFTNNSTEDIYEKIYNELKERWRLTRNKRCLYLLENINDLTICTLHKYLRTVIEQLGSWYGYSNNISMGKFTDKLGQFIDDIITNEFEITTFSCEDYGMYDINLKKIIKYIITNEKTNVSQIDNYIIDCESDSEKIKNISKLIRLICNKISEEFMSDLIDDDNILMNDINYKISDMLIYNDNFEKKIRTYKYVFIDECQDTSSNQFNILSKILNITKGNLFAVGDSLQAIYRFRNANPESMKNFNGIVDESLDLVNNYRTKKEILDQINKVFKNLKNKKYKSLESNNSGSKGVDIRRFYRNDKYSCIEKIVRIEIPQITQKRNSNNNKFNKEDRIAILVRNNSEAKKIFEELKHAGIECSIEKGGSLFQSKAARELLTLIRVILYPKSIIHKVQLLDTNYCNFNLNINSITFLTQYNVKLVDIILEDVMTYVNNSKTPFTILTDIIYEFNPSKDDSLYRQNLLLILEELINRGVTSSFSDIEQFLTRNLKLNNDTKSSEEKNAEDRVLISTFHSTKGLEFDTVILLTDKHYYRNIEKCNNKFDIIIKDNNIGIYYKNEESNRKAKENSNKIDYIENKNYNHLKEIEDTDIRIDEENLLYVAMTRAKEKLYVLAPVKIQDDTHAKILENGGFFGGGY